jgi:tetratricopeptide (TPR) repeat protein
MNTFPKSKKVKKDATFWVVLSSFCLLTFGLVAVTWFVIGGLQENSEKMRKYKTMPDDIGHGAAILHNNANVVFGDSAAKPEQHPKSSELSKQATTLLFQGKYKESIATMKESIRLLEDDKGASKMDANYKKVLARRYTILTACYLKMKDGQGALAAANKSLEYRPNSVFVLNRRADAYRLLGEKTLEGEDRVHADTLEHETPVTKTIMYRRAFGDQEEELEDE